jgi:hypothetical protein
MVAGVVGLGYLAPRDIPVRTWVVALLVTATILTAVVGTLFFFMSLANDADPRVTGKSVSLSQLRAAAPQWTLPMALVHGPSDPTWAAWTTFPCVLKPDRLTCAGHGVKLAKTREEGDAALRTLRAHLPPDVGILVQHYFESPWVGRIYGTRGGDGAWAFDPIVCTRDDAFVRVEGEGDAREVEMLADVKAELATAAAAAWGDGMAAMAWDIKGLTPAHMAQGKFVVCEVNGSFGIPQRWFVSERHIVPDLVRWVATRTRLGVRNWVARPRWPHTIVAREVVDRVRAQQAIAALPPARG